MLHSTVIKTQKAKINYLPVIVETLKGQERQSISYKVIRPNGKVRIYEYNKFWNLKPKFAA